MADRVFPWRRGAGNAWGLLAAVFVLLSSSPAVAEGPVGTLDDVIRLTVTRHESIEIAGESVEQARLMKNRYLMSLTPDISLQAYGKRGDAPPPPNGAGPDEDEKTTYGYAVTLTQPVYSGGRATAAYRGAGKTENALRLQRDLTARGLRVTATEAYYGVLSWMEAVRVGEQAVARAEKHLERSRRRLELGEGLLTDKLRAEVNVADVSASLIGYRSGLADARNQVERLCGCTLAESPAAVTPLEPIKGSVDELVEEALKGRLEVKQDSLGVMAAEEDRREKKGRFMPALYVAASYYGSGEEYDDQESGWEAGLYLEFPIYQRASRYYLLKESDSVLRQTKIRGEGRGRDIALEIKGLHNSLTSAEARIETLRKQVELARESLRLSEKRFDVGLADSLEAVDSQTTLLGAEVSLTAEVNLFEVSRLRLLNALGREFMAGSAAP